MLCSTLEAWVEPTDLAGRDNAAAFRGTAIEADPRAAAWRQRHPVVSLSLRNVAGDDLPTVLDLLGREVNAVLRRFSWLPGHPSFTDIDREAWAQLSRRPSPTALAMSLADITTWLHRATGAQVVVLIDEYDTPLQSAMLHGFYDEALAVFRPLLSAALKDNRALKKGVLTGITRVARESLFSGLNNLVVDSVLDRRFPTACGFTEPEVASLLALAGREDRLDDIRAWYDGYILGDVRIYNPWSILSWLGDPQAALAPWWVNTGSDSLLRDALATGAPELQADLEAILAGGSVEKPLIDHVILRDLDRDADAVWTVLVHAGYLQATDRKVEHGVTWARLRPPNHEVAFAWQLLFRRWLDVAIGGAGVVRDLVAALLAGDGPGVERALQVFALRNLSALDVGGPAPERVWHAFLLGLLAHMTTTHLVRSEAAAGTGRVDVLVLPRRAGAGAVIELKRRAAGDELDAALDDAMRQIDARRYVDRLREVGASPAWKVAVAFAGQEVGVRVLPA